MKASFVTTSLTRHGPAGPALPTDDDVAVEEPLEIKVEGRSIAVTMRTPGHDEELAVGFLLTEGVIADARDLLEVNRCPTTAGSEGNVVDVLLRRPQAVDFDRLTRHVFSASSCGLCGKATIAAVRGRFPALAPRAPLATSAVLGLLDQLEAAQATFHRTGGLHGVALFDAHGRLRVVREDVGRHNAVDKVVGHHVLGARLAHENVAAPLGLLVSGRVSFEIVQKALAARVSVVVGVSAPTSLAVAFAREQGQTLIGFLRPGRFNLYSGTLA